MRGSIAAVIVLLLPGSSYSQDWDGQKAIKDISCKTSMTFMQVHGTQVTYRKPDGKILLWYPGNAGVLPGLWKLETRPNQKSPRDWVHLCHFYLTTGPTQPPSAPEMNGPCLPLAYMQRFVVELVPGDVLKLTARKAVPFPLSRERTTIGNLLETVSKFDANRPPLPSTDEAECEAKTS